jgi:hypothetical protein
VWTDDNVYGAPAQRRLIYGRVAVVESLSLSTVKVSSAARKLDTVILVVWWLSTSFPLEASSTCRWQNEGKCGMTRCPSFPRRMQLCM